MSPIVKEWRQSRNAFGLYFITQIAWTLLLARSGDWLGVPLDPQEKALFVSAGAAILSGALAWWLVRDELYHQAATFVGLRPVPLASLLRAKYWTGLCQAAILGLIGGVVLVASAAERPAPTLALTPPAVAIAAFPLLFLIAAPRLLGRPAVYASAVLVGLIVGGFLHLGVVAAAAGILLVAAPRLATALVRSRRLQLFLVFAIVAFGSAAVLGACGTLWLFWASQETTRLGLANDFLVDAPWEWVQEFILLAASPFVPITGQVFVLWGADIWEPVVTAGWQWGGLHETRTNTPYRSFPGLVVVAPVLLVGLLSLLACLRWSRVFAARSWELAGYAGVGLLAGPAAGVAIAFVERAHLRPDWSFRHEAPGATPRWRFHRFHAVRAVCGLAAVTVLAGLGHAFSRSPLGDSPKARIDSYPLFRPLSRRLVEARDGAVYRLDDPNWTKIHQLRLGGPGNAYRRSPANDGVGRNLPRNDGTAITRESPSLSETRLISWSPEGMRAYPDPFGVVAGGAYFVRAGRNVLFAFPFWAAETRMCWELDLVSGRWAARRVRLENPTQATRRSGGWLISFDEIAEDTRFLGVTTWGFLLRRDPHGLALVAAPQFSDPGGEAVRPLTGRNAGGGHWVVLRSARSGKPLGAFSVEGDLLRRLDIEPLLGEINRADRWSTELVERHGRAWTWGWNEKARRVRVLSWDPARGAVSPADFPGPGWAHLSRARIVDASPQRVTLLRDGWRDRRMIQEDGTFLALRRGRAPQVTPLGPVHQSFRLAENDFWIFSERDGRKTTWRWDGTALRDVSGSAPFWR